SRRIDRRSDNTRWRRATPDADLATKRAGCQWPSWVGNSRCGRTSLKNPAVSLKDAMRIRNNRPEGDSLGGGVAATVVSIAIWREGGMGAQNALAISIAVSYDWRSAPVPRMSTVMRTIAQPG